MEIRIDPLRNRFCEKKEGKFWRRSRCEIQIDMALFATTFKYRPTKQRFAEKLELKFK